MINILKHIAGFIFLAIQLEQDYSVLTEKIGKCEVRTDQQGTLVANCLNVGINSIPQDLGANIEVLDISNNPKMTLNKDDLKNYPNVWAFIMMNINITSIPAGFFQHTKYLRMLNISNTQITDLKELPSSITYFNYSHCHLEYVDLSRLENVGKVYLRGCKKLRKIPNLPITAPLQVLDLKYCSLIEAHYSQIAPFCLIQYFGFDSEVISTEEHLERCCGMIRWSKIRGFDKNGYKWQKCFSNARYNTCNDVTFPFEQASLDAYAGCLKPILVKRFLKFVGVIIISLFILGFGCFILYVFVKKKLKALRQQKENITDSTDEAEAESDKEDGDVGDAEAEAESATGVNDEG